MVDDSGKIYEWRMIVRFMAGYWWTDLWLGDSGKIYGWKMKVRFTADLAIIVLYITL